MDISVSNVPDNEDPEALKRDIEREHLEDRAEEVSRKRGSKAAHRWHDIATGGKATPISMALERYLKARANDLRQSTVNDLKIEGRKFIEFLAIQPQGAD